MVRIRNRNTVQVVHSMTEPIFYIIFFFQGYSHSPVSFHLPRPIKIYVLKAK